MNVKVEMGLLLIGFTGAVAGLYYLNNKYFKSSRYFSEKTKRKHIHEDEELHALKNSTIPHMNNTLNVHKVKESVEKPHHYDKRI